MKTNSVRVIYADPLQPMPALGLTLKPTPNDTLKTDTSDSKTSFSSATLPKVGMTVKSNILEQEADRQARITCDRESAEKLKNFKNSTLGKCLFSIPDLGRKICGAEEAPSGLWQKLVMTACNVPLIALLPSKILEQATRPYREDRIRREILKEASLDSSQKQTMLDLAALEVLSTDEGMLGHCKPPVSNTKINHKINTLIAEILISGKDINDSKQMTEVIENKLGNLRRCEHNLGEYAFGLLGTARSQLQGQNFRNMEIQQAVRALTEANIVANVMDFDIPSVAGKAKRGIAHRLYKILSAPATRLEEYTWENSSSNSTGVTDNYAQILFKTAGVVTASTIVGLCVLKYTASKALGLVGAGLVVSALMAYWSRSNTLNSSLSSQRNALTLHDDNDKPILDSPDLTKFAIDTRSAASLLTDIKNKSNQEIVFDAAAQIQARLIAGRSGQSFISYNSKQQLQEQRDLRLALKNYREQLPVESSGTLNKRSEDILCELQQDTEKKERDFRRFRNAQACSAISSVILVASALGAIGVTLNNTDEGWLGGGDNTAMESGSQGQPDSDFQKVSPTPESSSTASTTPPAKTNVPTPTFAAPAPAEANKNSFNTDVWEDTHFPTNLPPPSLYSQLTWKQI